jgi:hypothetical protein
MIAMIATTARVIDRGSIKILRDPMKDARALFTWIDEQHQLADCLWDALNRGERAVQIEALLDSLSLFILITYPREPLSCRLI